MYLLVFTLIFSGCAKNTETTLEVKDQFMSNMTYLNFNEVLDEESSPVIGFKQLTHESDRSIKRIHLLNQSLENQALLIEEFKVAALEGGFEVVTTSCRASLGRGKHCFIDIKLVYDSTLADGTFKFGIIESEAGSGFGIISLVRDYAADISLDISDKLVPLNTEVDFGVLDENAFAVRRIHYGNIYTESFKVIKAQSSILTPESIASGFSILRDSCSGKELPPQRRCFIDLKYNFNSALAGQSISGSLSLNGNAVTLNVGLASLNPVNAADGRRQKP